ncbi:unnamed protein product [Calypogeia fissa]
MALPNFNTSDFYKDDTTVYLPPYSPTEPTTLIYFVTGNPGLIGYYATFLQSLSDILRNPQQGSLKPYRSSSNQSSNPNISVLGTSLAGFETESPRKAELQEGPFSLQEQIELCEERLGTFIHRHAASSPDFSAPTKVILMGHSVGAYILLELLRRQQERLQTGDEEIPRVDIVGGISLFPTVTWIAKSPSGRRLGWALTLPGFARVVGVLAKGLGFVVPEFILRRIVGALARMPPKAARTTTEFLKSPLGVRQALWMAADEMRMIEEDRWDDALWACERTRLVFYFGERDHWVDDGFRNELIRLRSVEGRDWPKMVLDQQRIPHDFCISRSEETAEITAEFVERILEK